MYDPPSENEPLLPPRSRDGIDGTIRWFFFGLFVLTVFVLVVVGIQQAEISALMDGPTPEEAPKPIDIGATRD